MSHLFCVHIQSIEKMKTLYIMSYKYVQTIINIEASEIDLVSIISINHWVPQFCKARSWKKKTVTYSHLKRSLCRIFLIGVIHTLYKEWIHCQYIWFWNPWLVGQGWMWWGCRHAGSAQGNTSMTINNSQW